MDENYTTKNITKITGQSQQAITAQLRSAGIVPVGKKKREHYYKKSDLPPYITVNIDAMIANEPYITVKPLTPYNYPATIKKYVELSENFFTIRDYAEAKKISIVDAHNIAGRNRWRASAFFIRQGMYSKTLLDSRTKNRINIVQKIRHRQYSRLVMTEEINKTSENKPPRVAEWRENNDVLFTKFNRSITIFLDYLPDRLQKNIQLMWENKPYTNVDFVFVDELPLVVAEKQYMTDNFVNQTELLAITGRHHYFWKDLREAGLVDSFFYKRTNSRNIRKNDLPKILVDHVELLRENPDEAARFRTNINFSMFENNDFDGVETVEIVLSDNDATVINSTGNRNDDDSSVVWDDFNEDDLGVPDDLESYRDKHGIVRWRQKPGTTRQFKISEVVKAYPIDSIKLDDSQSVAPVSRSVLEKFCGVARGTLMHWEHQGYLRQVPNLTRNKNIFYDGRCFIDFDPSRPHTIGLNDLTIVRKLDEISQNFVQFRLFADLFDNSQEAYKYCQKHEIMVVRFKNIMVRKTDFTDKILDDLSMSDASLKSYQAFMQALNENDEKEIV